jgi:hypothetical protein
MKKIIFSISMLLTAGLSVVSAANDPQPDQQVLDLFKKEFTAAQNVTWEKQDEYDKATFMLAGCRAVAYFNAAGELEGSVRDLFFNQLPLAVMTAVDKKYAGAEYYEVREVTNAEGTSYRLKLELNNKKYKVKVDAAGNIDGVEKLAK